MIFRPAPTIFRDRKIPKHLIIREEYEHRRSPRFKLLKSLFWVFALSGVVYVLYLNQIRI